MTVDELRKQLVDLDGNMEVVVDHAPEGSEGEGWLAVDTAVRVNVTTKEVNETMLSIVTVK